MREGALAGGLCLFHGEFLFFCDVVLSSDVNLQDTRKSPMGMEVPRGKRKPRMCAHARSRFQRLSHTTPIWRTPANSFPLPFWASSSPKGPVGVQKPPTGQMRGAGLRGTPVSRLPFRHLGFSALICWEATACEGRGAAVGTAPQHRWAQQHTAGGRDHS